MNTDSAISPAATENLVKFLSDLDSIREAITQTRRGPWTISFNAGSDRSLFVNKKQVQVNYEVDFFKARTAIDLFMGSDRKALAKVEEGIVPLQEFVSKTRKILQKHFENYLQENAGTSDLLTPIKEAIEVGQQQIRDASAAVRTYGPVMATHSAALDKIEAALADSLKEAKADLDKFLATQSVDHQEIIDFYNSYVTQMKESFTGLKKNLLEDIPQIYDFGMSAFEQSLSALEQLSGKLKNVGESKV